MNQYGLFKSVAIFAFCLSSSINAEVLPPNTYTSGFGVYEDGPWRGSDGIFHKWELWGTNEYEGTTKHFEKNQIKSVSFYIREVWGDTYSLKPIIDGHFQYVGTTSWVQQTATCEAIEMGWYKVTLSGLINDVMYVPVSFPMTFSTRGATLLPSVGKACIYPVAPGEQTQTIYQGSEIGSDANKNATLFYGFWVTRVPLNVTNEGDIIIQFEPTGDPTLAIDRQGIPNPVTLAPEPEEEPGERESLFAIDLKPVNTGSPTVREVNLDPELFPDNQNIELNSIVYWVTSSDIWGKFGQYIPTGTFDGLLLGLTSMGAFALVWQEFKK